MSLCGCIEPFHNQKRLSESRVSRVEHIGLLISPIKNMVCSSFYGSSTTFHLLVPTKQKSMLLCFVQHRSGAQYEILLCALGHFRAPYWRPCFFLLYSTCGINPTMVSCIANFPSSTILIVYQIIYATESCTYTYHSKKLKEFRDFNWRTKIIFFR